MDIPPGQEKTSNDPKEYSTIIVVFGSRDYEDKKEFHRVMCKYIKRFTEPILFVSGEARTGPERMIIDWCRKFKYPFFTMAPDWQTHPKAAVFKRDEELAMVATNGVVFDAGDSSSVTAMIEACMEKIESLKIFKVTLKKETK